ncbi:hypothetical protein NECAME_11090 [Necator americanus]|uniref:Uncharacterized protein n=1 Tax=Necator americanus TaxID=51031 RepID=W2T889_NECAM|nr:hypothetical protein NECAME_11090 [Necator americanus]ETN77391.1 hypothetical protein NECAME_11090 [Necator americanus]
MTSFYPARRSGRKPAINNRKESPDSGGKPGTVAPGRTGLQESYRLPKRKGTRMAICTYNARTLAAEAAIEDLMVQAKKIKYDVIGLTETGRRHPLNAAYETGEELSLETCDSRGVGGVGVLGDLIVQGMGHTDAQLMLTLLTLLAIFWIQIVQCGSKKKVKMKMRGREVKPPPKRTFHVSAFLSGQKQARDQSPMRDVGGCEVDIKMMKILSMSKRCLDTPHSLHKGKKGESETEEKHSDEGAGGPPPPAPRAPSSWRIAGTHDPNYQTLANIGGDIFGADKKGGTPIEKPKAPAAGGMAGTHDPNYQTLAGIGGDVFGADKKGGPGGAGGTGQGAKPQVPPMGGIAGTHDPNYQTLAGIGGDVFGEDKKKAANNPLGPKPGAGGMAGMFVAH